MFEFKITASDGSARTGEFTTPHGVVQTPVFMPVGTHGAVKGVSPQELREVGSQVILANTYHLYLRPGEATVAALGGLHQCMGWDGPILTDSGGFQVFSLGERGMAGQKKTALRQVSEEGITFKSHLDGSTHLFTPEKSIQVQQELGADIIMAFDQPVYGLSSKEAAREAMERTQRWLRRSALQWQAGDPNRQALFGIVQGGVHTDLHTESARFTAGLELPGNAIGGLSVGEGKELMWAATASICNLLPSDRPRYFMGLGEPLDLIEAASRGVDMYDCVSPSRLARHGAIWMPVGEGAGAFWEGKTERLLTLSKPLHFERWNLNNARFSEEKGRLASQAYLPGGVGELPLGMLHHYLKEGEMLGLRVLTLHNILLLHRVSEHIRESIRLQALARLREILS